MNVPYTQEDFMDEATIRQREELMERTDPLLRLSPEEQALLEASEIVYGPDPENHATLAALISSWSGHIEWLMAELGLDPKDPQDRWTPYDFLAALLTRNRVQHALQDLPAETVSVAERALLPVDERFRAFTEQDEKGLLEPLLAGDERRDGWWWQRVPKEGPVRFDMDELHERLAGNQTDPSPAP